jgi:peptidoglycan/xylan/chitin deacetylase (PgdA/CDA1 family)
VTPFKPLRWLAPAGPGARLSIFIFHRVLEREDPLRAGEPDASRFERIVAFIARHFHVLPMADAAALLAAGKLPAAAACITFDDGYADNLTIAAPILRRYDATATIFVSTAFIGGGRMWNDSVIEAVRAAPTGELDWRDFDLGLAHVDDVASRKQLIDATLPMLKYMDSASRAAIANEMAQRCGVQAQPSLMLSRSQILECRALGFDIGGHTVEHPILSRLSDQDAAAEVEDGRAQLAEWLGEAPRAFAYPNGVPGRDYSARDVALVRRAGYACAVSTARGAATRFSDPYQLPRYMPWDAARGAIDCNMEVRR